MDIEALRLPTLLAIRPMTDSGRQWLLDNVGEPDTEARNWLAEHRYGPAILLAACHAGLAVSLDGVRADIMDEED